MQVRTPDIDFSQVAPIWAPANPAFGHRYDAASILLPYLEPYLIRVMRDAKKLLQEKGLATDTLSRDIDLFNKQEGQHYQLHTRYNDYLKSFYPGLEAFEMEVVLREADGVVAQIVRQPRLLRQVREHPLVKLRPHTGHALLALVGVSRVGQVKEGGFHGSAGPACIAKAALRL